MYKKLDSSGKGFEHFWNEKKRSYVRVFMVFFLYRKIYKLFFTICRKVLLNFLKILKKLFIIWIIEGSYISHWRSRISRKNILCLKKKVGEQRLVLTLQRKHEICHSLPRAWSPWWVGDMDLPQAKHFFLLISHEQSLHKGLFLCIYNFSFKGWLQRVQ